MSAVLTGTSSIDVSRLSTRPQKMWCSDCDVYWVESPVCPTCLDSPGVPYPPTTT